MKPCSRLLGRLISVILVLLLICNIWIISAESKQGVGVLYKLPFAFIPVSGSSMEPSLSSGDAVLAVQTPYEELKTGDVIIYSLGTELVVHELIEIDGERFTAQGTANAIADSPAVRNQYKAKVLFKVPGLGAVWRIVSTPVSMLAFTVLITAIVFGKDIFSAIYGLIFKEK